MELCIMRKSEGKTSDPAHFLAGSDYDGLRIDLRIGTKRHCLRPLRANDLDLIGAPGKFSRTYTVSPRRSTKLKLGKRRLP